MNTPQIGWGQVRHARLRPVRHAFDYPVFFLMLPLRTMRNKRFALAHNRPALVSFHDSDHGDGRADALDWLDELLRSEGISDATGEAWLHCFPRMAGYAFKPVSFWYCHRPDGSLRAIVVEVNNTLGDRHCYLLDAPAYGHEQRARKVFHVSPFCEVAGEYRFRFMRTADGSRTVVRIDHDDAQGPLLQTSVSGELKDATAGELRRAFWRFPLMTLGIVARIHWHALRLWAKRVPFHNRPAARGAPGTSR